VFQTQKKKRSLEIARQNRTSSNPEQIQAMFFSNGPPVQVVTLVHYKMWAESSVWLPAIYRA